MLPRIAIANLPTPIQHLPRLSSKYGGPNIYIKRDDLTGLAFGGNKTRKLELLIAEAKAHGAKTLITGGAIQSNHCRQTAAAAAKFGFNCILVLTSPEKEPLNKNISGNLFLDKLFHAEIIWAERQMRDKILSETFQNSWDSGQRPYLIPYGGSNMVGSSAYAYAVKELLEQLSAEFEFPSPDWIAFASSSGGTQAGLVAGASIYNYGGKILGISIDEEKLFLKEKVANLATSVAEYLGNPKLFSKDDILVSDDYLGEGYGVMSDLEEGAILDFARLEGILLDPVYTGRAAAGLLNMIKTGYIGKNDNVLFWHTGGTPALFADPYLAALNSLFGGTKITT